MDPYRVLGLSPDCTNEELKSTYRNLVKKYHPDNYASDPDLAKMADEKMKEINSAYDEILKIRTGSKTGFFMLTCLLSLRQNGGGRCAGQ